MIVVLLGLIAIIFFITINLNKKREELKVLKEKFKDIVDLEKEKEFLNSEINKLKVLKEKFKDIVDLEKEKESLNSEIIVLKNTLKQEKEKILEVIDYREKINKEVSLLEETKELQEFAFYQPKFYYDSSIKYREKITELNEKMKKMIKEKKAAICTTQWEVGGSKKEGQKMMNETLKLMLRAFNGEVDFAIAKVKYNNISVMEARIRKSFEIINKLNEVKTCFIRNEYLECKIDELYLNFEMSRKLEEEKEEIRRAREEDREIERARKEYEKAQAEALKEEERTRKALEQAEENLKRAHGEELEKLNEKIENLKRALEKAKKDKERAKSMAELTKAGHVYIISNIGSFGENVYKIGMTRRLEPMDRVRELGDASVPFNFDVHAMIYSENAPELENILHKEFYDKRINKVNDRREFFRVNLSEIEKVAKKYNSDIKFTMKAEAEQFRQSLALENNSINETLNEHQQKKIQQEKEYILSI